MYAVRESLTGRKDRAERLAEIDAALESPTRILAGGVPSWYGDDDEAWDDWKRQARTG